MSTPNIIWLKNGRILKQVEDTIQMVNNLPKKVYNLGMDPRTNELFLEEFSDGFHFDFKVYGLESNLVKHIMETYNNTKGNLGILFNGVKGTGKTITAKIIANETNLPIILINAPYPGLSDFIAKINCSCVLFFDEFEKNFDTRKGQDVELLSIMDGVFNSPYRRVFLLTTNSLQINENFIGRPSRIRYKKSFGNLSSELVMEYLNDCLINKERAQEILEFIDSLSISTIDILKCIVEEVNIHNCPVSEFKQFINVEQAKHSYITKMSSYNSSEKHSIDIFKKELARIGTQEIDSEGNPITIEQSDLNIYNRTVSSSSSVEFLQVGDFFAGFGTVVIPLTEDGIIVTEDEYYVHYFKILNLNERPSLYRGRLTY